MLVDAVSPDAREGNAGPGMAKAWVGGERRKPGLWARVGGVEEGLRSRILGPVSGVAEPEVFSLSPRYKDSGRARAGVTQDPHEVTLHPGHLTPAEPDFIAEPARRYPDWLVMVRSP